MRPCAHAGERLRCVGSALSPNGISFSEEGVLSLALMDRILKIDKQKMQARACAATCSGRCICGHGTMLHPHEDVTSACQGQLLAACCDVAASDSACVRTACCAQVTVEAGARIQDVVDKLRPHGLTLQNFASIREQSVGGFTQVHPHDCTTHVPARHWLMYAAAQPQAPLCHTHQSVECCALHQQQLAATLLP